MHADKVSAGVVAMKQVMAKGVGDEVLSLVSGQSGPDDYRLKVGEVYLPGALGAQVLVYLRPQLLGDVVEVSEPYLRFTVFASSIIASMSAPLL